MFKLLLVFSCCLAVGLCALAFQLPNPNAAKGTCITSDSKTTMLSGETKQIPNSCAIMTCSSDGSISYESCGVAIFNGKRCPEDLSKPYPECCNYNCK